MVVQVTGKFVEKLNFVSKRPESHVRSQWQSAERSVKFLIFRWFLAFFFIGCVAYAWANSINDGTFGFWFIYMTNWGIMICAFATIFSAILTTFYHYRKIELTSESKSYKISWWLSNVATVLALQITIVYWAVLFNGKTTIIDVWIHAGNSLGMLMEISVAEYSFRIFHFIHPIFIGLIYMIFTLIYYYAGGVDSKGNNYIYTIINWGEKPLSTTIIVLGVAVLLIFLHIISFLIQKFRKRIYKKYFSRATLQINGTATQTV